MRSTVVQHPELLFIALLSQWIRTLEQQPTLVIVSFHLFRFDKSKHILLALFVYSY